MKSTLVFVLGLALGLAGCNSAPSPSPTASQGGTAEQPGNSAPNNESAGSAKSNPGGSISEMTKSAAPPIELPAGSVVVVRLDQALSTASNQKGDKFDASLDAPIMANGKEVLPRGTKFTGHVTTADASGRLQGRGVLGITLDSFELQGQRYPVATSLDTKTTESHKKRNIEMIGGGAGIGALIGGLVGGGKGAAIGAGAGAAAGTGTAATTGKKEVVVPAETIFRFKVKAPVSIRVE